MCFHPYQVFDLIPGVSVEPVQCSYHNDLCLYFSGQDIILHLLVAFPIGVSASLGVIVIDLFNGHLMCFCVILRTRHLCRRTIAVVLGM